MIRRIVRRPYCKWVLAANNTHQGAVRNERVFSSLGDVAATERTEEIVERLRRGGGRMTRPRRMVIDALVQGPGHHMTAADIVAAVRADDPEFYESTVYRTLDLLLELGIVERVQLGPGGAVFHLPHRPHHHLVCERCGDVLEIPADLARRPRRPTPRRARIPSADLGVDTGRVVCPMRGSIDATGMTGGRGSRR